jgi:hypothetical protein
MFSGRKLIIATKHQKESVIAPIAENALGVKCFVDQKFDTDVLGTFTGEVERQLDPIATARQKCLMAMDLTGCDLGIASEGSFGPHPAIYFVDADEEIMIFIDRKHNLEIIARELSTATNFNGRELNNLDELWDFANSVNFPSHGLILRKSKADHEDIYKGIMDRGQLEEAFLTLLGKHQKVYAETDMRALFNPTRMKVIEAATIKLINQIKSECPKCKMPGFNVSAAQRGLKCSLCGNPTNSVFSYHYECRHCNYHQEELYPHQKTSEDPGFCDYCNP